MCVLTEIKDANNYPVLFAVELELFFKTDILLCSLTLQFFSEIIGKVTKLLFVIRPSYNSNLICYTFDKMVYNRDPYIFT